MNPNDKQVATITEDTAPVVKQAEALVIKGPEEMLVATELLSTVNKRLDLITEEKERITRPANEILKRERARWKPLENICEQAIQLLRGKMTTYQTEAKKIEAEKKEKIVDRIGEGRGKISVETAITKMEAATVLSAVTADSGAIKFRTVEKFRVVDMKLLPVIYVLPNEPLIREAMKNKIAVPGVEYFTEETPINFRAKY